MQLSFFDVYNERCCGDTDVLSLRLCGLYGDGATQRIAATRTRIPNSQTMTAGIGSEVAGMMPDVYARFHFLIVFTLYQSVRYIGQVFRLRKRGLRLYSPAKYEYIVIFSPWSDYADNIAD